MKPAVLGVHSVAEPHLNQCCTILPVKHHVGVKNSIAPSQLLPQMIPSISQTSFRFKPLTLRAQFSPLLACKSMGSQQHVAIVASRVETKEASARSPLSCGHLEPHTTARRLNWSSKKQYQRGEMMLQKAAITEEAATGSGDKLRWWEVDHGAKMQDIHSVTEFVEALSAAGERLVVVDFYATWCGSCKALFPKLCQLSIQYQDAVFLKVNFDENKPLCKSLNIRVLPFLHFYRGAEGRLDAFSASISKIQKVRDALATHSTERCSLGPPLGAGELTEVTAVPTTKERRDEEDE